MYKRQQGLSLLGWIVIVFVAAVFATAAIKLGPKYAENYTITSIVERVAASSAANSKGQLRAEIQKNFNVSMVTELKAKDIKIETIKGGYSLDPSYEIRVPFLYNIDVVLKFEDSVIEMKK
ncbi:uncharacterized protein DUF4845 [Sinobacterium caligoides]|uniref:Uncharacterized protein DUF4845 n=1 Tax=Sinobacterium caligoides TaxID=933926 RepID=A0A3N2DXX8_9GAMM|nr:DUF4845 domain-containing protein [Sinobacterium caligoides]ROS04716.1 uncharacterized protein DUF4845 [Sinobacterium caligoides]